MRRFYTSMPMECPVAKVKLPVSAKFPYLFPEWPAFSVNLV